MRDGFLAIRSQIIGIQRQRSLKIGKVDVVPPGPVRSMIMQACTTGLPSKTATGDGFGAVRISHRQFPRYVNQGLRGLNLGIRDVQQFVTFVVSDEASPSRTSKK